MLVFPEMSFFLVSLLVLLLYKYTAIEASYGAILKLLYNSKDKISQYYNCCLLFVINLSVDYPWLLHLNYFTTMKWSFQYKCFLLKYFGEFSIYLYWFVIEFQHDTRFIVKQ